MDTDQMETLVGKLAALLSEITADEIAEVMHVAKTRLTNEAKIRERLETFNGRVKTLIDKGYPEAAGMKNDQFLGYVDPLRDRFEIGDIIVIPECIVAIPRQMSMVKLAGKTGYADPNLGVFRNVAGVKTPNVPYLSRRVENGAIMRKTSPNNCIKQFRRQRRFGLVTEEGIAIVTNKPWTLNDHYITLPGSCCESADKVPGIYLDYDGRPGLNCFGADDAFDHWGSASCGSRILA